MPALVSLLISMAFTLVAVSDQDTARKLAIPVAVVAIALMLAQAHKDRGHA